MREQSYVIFADPPLAELLDRFALPSAWFVVLMTDWDAIAVRLSELPAPALVVVARVYLDTALLRELDEWCQHNAISWTQLYLEHASGWLGPLVVPGATASYRDLLARRQAVAESAATHHALLAPPCALGWSHALPAQPELVWIMALLLAEIERWRATTTCALLSAEIEANALTLTLRQYPLLPLPAHMPADLQIGSPKDAALLINRRSGIIIRTREVEHLPFVPSALKTVQSHVAFMGWHDPTWQNDTICGGSTFGSLESARQAAIGEAVERYCGSTLGAAHPIRASYNQLVAHGDYALDPAQLILFTERVYQRADCPLVPFGRDTATYWVLGRSLTHDRPAWLPISLVYFDWDRERFADLPLTNWLNYAGIAAGTSFEHALVSGIEELIERDSTMVWWYNQPRLPAIRLPPQLAQLWHGAPTEHGQRAWAIPIPNEFDIPVLAGVVENTRDQLLTIGFACRPDPLQATLKAWSEALILEESAYDLMQPDGRTYGAIAAGWLPSVLKPWRADRAYLDDYRADSSDVSDLTMQLQLALDPRLPARLRPWLDIAPQSGFESICALPDRSLATYRQRLESRGFELFCIDLTLPDIAVTGMRVARVIIPGLVPNTPAAFPPLGRGRIQQMAVQLGWRATMLHEDALHYGPMPHA